METRINPYEQGQKAVQSLYGIGGHLGKTTVKKPLLDLIYYRLSQINGCAFCLDMHSKDLRAEGETEQRLYGLTAWREAPYYTDEERAALSWAEAVNHVSGGVSDDIYNHAMQCFSPEELIDLTLAVIAINSYNRINIAFRVPAGNYQPGQYQTK